MKMPLNHKYTFALQNFSYFLVVVRTVLKTNKKRSLFYTQSHNAHDAYRVIIIIALYVFRKVAVNIYMYIYVSLLKTFSQY